MRRREGSKPRVQANTIRSSAERSEDISKGIRAGLRLAVALGVIASVILVINAVQTRNGNPLSTWLFVVVFYIVAGILGGALFGLLRPLRHRYLGRVVIAYLLLVLVYGGGSFAFYPLIARRPNPPSLATLLIAWAAVSLILAPIYVAIAKNGALSELWNSSQEE